MNHNANFDTPRFGQNMPSYFRSVKSSDSTPLDWQTFYHMVTTDTTLQANTDIARKAFESGDAHKYAVMKALGGAVIPGGAMPWRPRREEHRGPYRSARRRDHQIT
jgi:hypothetical protein